MNVWIVEYDVGGGEHWIAGVFTTEEKAEAYINKLDPPEQRWYDSRRDYRMEEHEVDK